MKTEYPVLENLRCLSSFVTEEAHQQLMEQFPLRKHKIITEKAVRNVIGIYPEPLYKKKVRGDRI